MDETGTTADGVVTEVNATMSSLVLVSPLQGWSTPLDEAPDPVFAGRLLGDGLAIDPTSPVLCAPCAGTVISVAAAKHAVSLRAANGLEILLHVGIDTVALGGQGFALHVREGQEVAAGERLLTFDLDLLARRAKSVLTPVILTGGAGFTITRRCQDRRVEVGEFLIEVGYSPVRVSSRQSAPVPRDAAATQAVQRRVVVESEHGIHARPAALIVASVKNFSADVRIGAGGRSANARSPIALMSLGIQKGDSVMISASGVDSEAALEALERGIRQSLEEPDPSPVGQLSPNQPHSAAASGLVIPGVVANPGLAVGYAYQLARAELEVAEAGTEPQQECTHLQRARDLVREQLRRTGERQQSPSRAIAEAHLALIDDPELLERAGRLIELGKSAGFAWRSAMRTAIQALRALADPRMRERADDLLDLESSVLVALGATSPQMTELPADSIVIADELLPSQLVGLDAQKLTGLCLARGGPTSHVVIIAGAMDVPTLVAAGPDVLRVATGTPLILDAEAGRLHIAAPMQELEVARVQVAERRARRASAQAAAQCESRTADGRRIEVFANVGSVTEARLAVRNGAEGCGLLRTEFLFLERQSAPNAAEQAAQYQQIAQALGNRPLTIRTLDIGADKPISYLPLPHEENPALGLRGIRTSLRRPELLRLQLQAVLRVQPAGQCRILLPMITDPEEIGLVRRILDELIEALPRTRPELGAMIETPAAAVMADRIAREADFLSIGTNDLTQYTLAMDRGQPDLAARLDGLHPAVLRLIAKTAEAARNRGRHVAVCGGLASDAAAVPVLIGLGVNELSMVPAVIPLMKALIAQLRAEECAGLAAAALEEETAADVRALVRKRLQGLEAAGLSREGAP
jgi:phosphocarrier protein FPr/phosphocarrier protein